MISFRPHRSPPWKLALRSGVVGGAALLVSACAAPRPAPVAAQEPRAIPVEAQPARRADLQQTLAASGELRAKAQVTVYPKASGQVDQLLVDVGSRVQAGDVLAVLEQERPALQVAQARAALATAQAQRARVNAGARAEDIGAASAALQAQQAGLQAAEARLELLQLGGRSEAVAEAQVAQAQATLDAARARLAQVRKGATSDQRQQAQSQLASAKAALAAAEAATQNVQTVQGAAIAQRDAARTALAQNFAPTAADILAAEAATQQARADLRAAEQCTTALGGALDSAVCDANKAAAQTALDLAEARLALLKKGGTAAQQAQVTAVLAQAEGSLKSVETQRASLEAQAVQARESVKAAQAVLDKLVAGAEPEEIQQAEATVRQAEQQLQLAITPAQAPTEQDVRAQEAQVAQLQRAVEQARFQLQKVRAPYTSEDRAQAQAAVDQAQAQLDLAELGVRDATITAPVEGVVAERLVSPGALVGPTTPLVTLVPPELELVVNVDEAQLGQLAEGQVATLQVAAFPDQSFSGVLKTIAPVVDPRSRTAAVRVEPRDGGGKLRAGMFARLSIVTAAQPNALVVPKAAVLGLAPGEPTTVFVVGEGNRVRKQQVRLGLVGDGLVEVVAGVDAGQLVVTSGLADLSDGDLVAPQGASGTALGGR